MKNIFFISVLFILAFGRMSAQSDKLNELFDKYQNTDGITSIKIAKPMFGMLSNLNIADSELQNIKPLLGKIQGLKMLIIQDPENPGSSKTYANLSKEVLTSLSGLNYQELMSVNKQDSKIKFLTNNVKNGIMDNLLLNINSGDSTVLMFLDCKISMDDINSLVKENQTYSTTTTTNSQDSSVITSSSDRNYTDGESEIRNVGSFSGIQTSAGINVVFTQSRSQLVKVETDPGMQKYIKTEVLGGILRISIDNNGVRNLRFRKILVTVNAPTLENLKVTSGASFTTTNRVASSSMDVDVSSGASVKADFNIKNELKISTSSGASAKIDLEAGTLTFDSSSGSSTTLVGRAGQADYEASSASSCNAQNVVARNVTAKASSGATLKVNAMESLETHVSSGASVRYKGNPEKMNAKNSSGGSTRKMD